LQPTLRQNKTREKTKSKSKAWDKSMEFKHN
jgi:hypothetical protein